MKTIAVTLIRTYQVLLSPMLKMLMGISNGCRFTPSCSEYAIQQIQQRGVLSSLPLIVIRIASCQPLNKQFGVRT